MEYKVLTQPLTQEEIKSHMDTNGYVTENIILKLDNVTHLTKTYFYDRLSKAVIGSPFLTNITYTVIGLSDDDGLIIRVHGYVSFIFEKTKDELKEIRKLDRMFSDFQ